MCEYIKSFASLRVPENIIEQQSKVKRFIFIRLDLIETL